MAYVEKYLQQLDAPDFTRLSALCRAFFSRRMEIINGGFQRSSMHELHDVIRLAIVIESQVMNRHDAGMLELAGNLSFAKKSISCPAAIGAQAFERHLASDAGI